MSNMLPTSYQEFIHNLGMLVGLKKKEEERTGVRQSPGM